MEITSENVEKQVADEERNLFLDPDRDTVKSVTSDEKVPDTIPLKSPPDGGYGWVVLVASFMISFILDAIMYSFGIILAAIKEHYDVSNWTANMLTSLYTGFFLLCGPLVSGVLDQFGFRVAIMGGAFLTSVMFFVSIFAPNIYVMYVTIGVIGGTTTGMFYLSCLVIIAHYFDKLRGLATGITMAGSGIGFFVGPPLFEMGIKKYGLRAALLAISGLLMINAVIGVLSKSLNPPKSSFRFGKKKRIVEKINVEIMSGSIVSLKKEEEKQKKKENVFLSLFKEMTDFTLLYTNWRFLLITLSNFFVFSGYFLPFLFVAKVAALNGLTNPSFVISIIGIVNIPGRIIFGLLADIPAISPLALNSVSVLIGAFPLLAYEQLLQYQAMTQYAFGALYALSTSGVVTLTTPYLCEIVNLDKIANATGIVSLFRGFGCFIGPVIGGIIADKIDMVTSFYFCGGCFVIGFVLSAIVSFSMSKKKNTKAESS